MWSTLKSALRLEAPEVIEARRRMALDHQDPRRRFVFALLAISCAVDPAYDEDAAHAAITDGYGIRSRDRVVPEIGRFLGGTGSTPAYDAFRAAFLARAGQGAGMLDVMSAWAWAGRAGQLVQRSYPSFRDYGMGYIDGHLDHRRREGDDPATLERQRQTLLTRVGRHARGVWARTPFDTHLGT
jgi:hypothetical protein